MSDRPIKVIAIDDDAEDIDLIRIKLKKVEYGEYIVESYTDYNEALQRVSSSGYDVCLVDYNMGGENGLDFIKASIESGCRAPIILLTGQGDRDIDLEAMRLGAADYLSKDEITPTLLERSIRYSIEKKKAELKLLELSITDKLTGLFNRRHFDEVLSKEWERAVRGGYEISLILIDIDFFKPFNDIYGHVEGDKCLTLVGEVIGSAALRPGDLAARYGGEEMAVILPNTSVKDALFISEKIRLGIYNLKIAHEGTRVDGMGVVSISSGISTMVPVKGISPSEVIKSADTALYRAKEEGRNSVVTAGSCKK